MKKREEEENKPSRASWSDRIKRLTRATRYLSTLDHRSTCSAIQSISFITKILGRRLSSNREQRDEQEMIPHRLAPVSQRLLGKRTFYREGRGGGASIGNIGIPRAAQRFRGSASFEEEARERPISSPAFQQCGFICVTISREGKGGSDWPSKEYTRWHMYTWLSNGVAEILRIEDEEFDWFWILSKKWINGNDRTIIVA